MAYIGKQPTPVPLTAADFADDTITEAKMANDAISLAELKAGTDGNIISYDASGDPVAIATGNDRQVLTSTGAGSPPAFEAAGGGAHSLLQTQNASDSASIAFNSTYITSTYRDYMVIVSSMTPASEGYKLKLYISDDNGSSYKSGSGYDYGTRGFNSAAGTAHTAEQNSTTGFQLFDDTTPNDAERSVSFILNMFHPLSTSAAFHYYCNGHLVSTDDNGHLFHSGGYYDADRTDAINNIKFQMSSGNITSGQFRLYGIT